VLFAIVWAAAAAAAVTLAVADSGTLFGLPAVTKADQPYVLGAAGGAGLISLLLLATSRRRSERGERGERGSKGRGRPLRMLFGVISGIGGGVALATSELSVEPALMAGGLTGGGAISLLLSFWSFVTSKRRVESEAEPVAPAVPASVASSSPAIALESDLVARQLREDGWFVVEGMHLQMSYADYVAVGPAGVLAIQTFWTDVSEDGNGVRARARIAAAKVREVLDRRGLLVDVIPVVLVCGPLPAEITEAVAVVDDVAVLVARRSEQWRAELRQSNALGMERFEAARDFLSSADPAELARAT
jgi:hypothetical protein